MTATYTINDEISVHDVLPKEERKIGGSEGGGNISVAAKI